MHRPIVLLLLVCAGPAQAPDCPTLLHLKGYLSQAEARCGVKEQAAPEQAAHRCATQLGAAADALLGDGVRFAAGEETAKGGTARWCAFVRQSWKSLIAP